MSRNGLYLVIGVLAAAVAVIGYMLYEERQSGIEIEIGEKGISVQGN